MKYTSGPNERNGIDQSWSQSRLIHAATPMATAAKGGLSDGPRRGEGGRYNHGGALDGVVGSDGVARTRRILEVDRRHGRGVYGELGVRPRTPPGPPGPPGRVSPMTDGGLRPLGLGELQHGHQDLPGPVARPHQGHHGRHAPHGRRRDIIRMSTGSEQAERHERLRVHLVGRGRAARTSSSTRWRCSWAARWRSPVVSIFATALAVGGALRCVASVYLGEEVGWRGARSR